MGKFLAALLLIILAGVPAYIMATGAVVDFDVVTAEHPLGQFERVDAWLKKHEFEPTQVQRGARGPKGTTHQRYKETIAAESGQFLCYVDLWSDSEGGVRTLHFGVTNELAWEVGLACGGEIEIFVERVE